MAVPKADRQLEAHTSQVLAPDERLIAGCRALAVGAFEGRLGILGELLTGAIMQSLLTGESVRRAHRAGFPAAPRMVIAMTDRRLLVWRAGFFSHRPVRFLGDVPLHRLSAVSVQPAVDRRRMTFSFVDSAPISVTGYKRDRPERFAESFQRPLMAPPAPTVPAEPVEAPAPVPAIELSLVPVSSLAAAATLAGVAASASSAPPIAHTGEAVAVGPALPPPPPPPVESPRPPRPAARSWAQAMPVATSSASPSGERGPNEKTCKQCGTASPQDAAFCWRCFVPFGQLPPAQRPLTPLAGPAPTPIAGSLDSAVKPSLSWAAVPARVKTKYRSPWVSRLAVAAVVVLVAFVAYGGARDAWARYTRKHVVVPQTIAGMTRIDAPTLQPYVRQLETLAQQNGVTGKAAYYGFSGQPRFYFAAFEYKKSSEMTPDEIFADFARGYSTGKAKIDLTTKTMDPGTEATFICARVRGGFRGSLCMWTDDDIVGFVQTVRQGIQATHDLTAVVRFSVEG